MALGSGRISLLCSAVLFLSISRSFVSGRPDASPAPAPVHADCPSWYDPFHPTNDTQSPLPPYPKPFEPGPLTTRFIYTTLAPTAEGYNITYTPNPGPTGTYTVIVARAITTTTIVDISAYTTTSYPVDPSDPWKVIVG